MYVGHVICLLSGHRNVRKELAVKGYVDIKEQRFIKDYTFNSAYEAFCCCYGRHDNGIAKFYTIDNIELDKFLKDSKKRYYLEKDDEELVISTDNVGDEYEEALEDANISITFEELKQLY